MKFLTIALVAVLFSGCASTTQKNAGTFLNTVASMDITANDVHQKTTGPFYQHEEDVTAFTKTADGFTVSKLSATFDIPMPVFGVPLLHWELTANAISGAKLSAPSLSLLAAPPK